VKLLLDTHVFIWLVEGNTRLSPIAKTAIADLQVEVFLSIASIWEMAIKVGNGKLTLSESLDVYIDRWLVNYGIKILPVAKQHALCVATIPQHHRDPFDRILIAQAICDGLTLVSADSRFHAYAVSLIW
jgi:PIN domain nuclease of toxin-antitoxin system